MRLWTYSAEDFLLFSPRSYWRLIERHNEALWPAQVLALLAGAAIVLCLFRPRPWSGRAVAGVLTVAWGWVAWSFLWGTYATINWAAAYVAPVFVLQALLLVGVGARLRWSFERSMRGFAGLGLFLYALVLHPCAGLALGRSIWAVEVFGIMPDPTAIATLGLVLMASGRGAGWLFFVPVAWCVASWATLQTMGTPDAWVPLLAVGLAIGAWVFRRTG
ncbi:DUF6064 family protein [Pararobbsia alpina]|uniref:MFS transporter permease n=1 Tax=Pararobbsia alpina TaxID=621374 RepID=A0A6S7CEY6_9BURK|nr:DUF6064 family protein [Pararobbsia alpina]CAB3788013.1 hypothetical protein LMG28138_02557 [Pararobbsia alpina]